MASTHKHIRSGTANKRPTTAIADGQIALNTNLSSPGLFFKDSTGAEILKIGPVHVGATAPNASPAGSAGNSTGEIWLDTSLTPVGVKIWNGSAFVNATPIGSTTVQGLLELATDAETQAGADTARAVTSASLQSKLSDSTSTTSNTTIASSTAVKAAYDLANAALPKTGGTVTGNLEIGTAGSLSFEGATADGFETTIAVVDPTADRTITLPNTTGTVVTTGDSGTVTSTMLLDGTILNEDINASASIAYSKLATLTSGNIVLGSSANVATSTAVTGDVTITNAGVTAIAAGVIVNADVNASAAIAGSKVAPDFGAQNIVTTGSSTAATFNPTGTTAPVTGVYSPGANRLGITTNSVERVEFGTSEVVFNDDAADYDFRIEGDTNSNLFFADASAEAVGIRTATPVSEFNVSVGNGGNITISNTNDAHSAGLAFGDTTSNSSGRITYDHSTNALAISSNGVERVRLSSTGEFMFKGAGTTPGTDKAVSFNGSAPVNSMVLDSSGRLGIGTSSPAGKVMILGADTTSFGTITNGALNLGTVNGTANGRFVNLNFGYDGGATNAPAAIGFIYTAQTGNGAGALYFGTRSVTTDTAPTERMVITSAGLVGIGTTSPTELLSVNGNIWLGNGGGSGGSEMLRIWNDSGVERIHGSNNPSALAFGMGGSSSAYEAFRVDSSRRLLVGTSTAQGDDTLQIQGDASGSSASGKISLRRGLSASQIGANVGADLGWVDFSGNDNSLGARIGAYSDANWGANDYPTRLVFSTTADGASSPTERLRIGNAGGIDVSATGNADNYLRNTAGQTTASGANLFIDSSNGVLRRSTSSIKYKTDVETLQDSYADEILKCRPVWYRSKSEYDNQQWGHWGFIAEEVAEIDPRLCFYGENEDGSLEPEGVQYDRFVPHLLNLIKRQQQAIEDLQAEVAALKAQ